MIARLRELPPETQDTIACAMPVRVDAASEPVALTPEDKASLARSLEQAARGGFAGDEEVEAIRAKHGL
ncbi:hypothetical protein [Methylobacterium frigidaeris]|uniref:hypothetical protein n=1 Tax=Methylobacterium frigidaeris TaxID=2038277 RepID=UPI001FCFD4DA|nr:hypothetical protein [Methylobacterium frigidaeris]